MGVASKNCAPAAVGNAASPKLIATRLMAKTSWPPLPVLVRTNPIGAVFDRNRGKFKPLAAVCHPFVTPADLC
jgi:hypothetical protein